METLEALKDYILHLDDHLESALTALGSWTYLILALIVFCETGLIVTPFLPGDSLLFAAGAFAATGHLSLPVVILTLIAAAIAGDAVNYAIGRRVGLAVIRRKRLWLVRAEHVERTHAFYRRHGGKAILLARFVPIARTFAPFVAGAARMDPRKFFFYNVAGAVLWVVVCTLAGYWFGRWPIVKENFWLVTIGVIVVSILPFIFEFVRDRFRRRDEGAKPDADPDAPPDETSAPSGTTAHGEPPPDRPV